MRHSIYLTLSLFIFLFSLSVHAADSVGDCTYARHLVQEEDHTFYVVESRAPSLYMISRDLYGNEENWRNIARWNQLIAPYALEKGQHLLIKVPPRLSDEEGTKVLISAWARFHDTDRVQHLTNYLQSIKSCSARQAVVSAPKPVPEEKPAPVETPKKEEEKIEGTTVEEEKESLWKFSVGIGVSGLQIDSTEKTSGIKNTLYSKADYSVELEIERELSEKWGLSLSAGLTHVEMAQPSDSVIENPVQNIPELKLDLDYNFTKIFGMSLGADYSQHLMSEPNPEGTSIDPVYVTELSLGAKLRLTEAGRTKLWLLAEGIYALPTKQKGYDIKSGTGYSAALQFQHEMKKTEFWITPKYEFLHQDTETSKDQEQTLSLNLGLTW